MEALFPPLLIWRHRLAIQRFLRRDLMRRYRLNLFGYLWMLLAPLITLGIYLFVFGVVLESRWATASGQEGTAVFGVYLFAGLVVFWLMSDVLGAAPGAITGAANLVKKTVFPVEILPIVNLCGALVHALISSLILLGAVAVVLDGIPVTAVLIPVVLLPLVLLLAGLSLALAGLGVFIRDISHLVGLGLTGALFLSPILYPIDRLGPAIQMLVMLNPVSVIVIELRRVAIEGLMPQWGILGVYFGVAWIVFALGLVLFRRIQKSFADVL